MLPVPGSGTGGGGMLVVETIARIRREFFVKGRSIKEIVRDLKVSRNTVRKVLRSGETVFAYEREVQPLPKLGRWRDDLDRMLVANEAKAARERLTLMPSSRSGFSAKKAATTLCAATPAPGSGAGRRRQRMPMCR